MKIIALLLLSVLTAEIYIAFSEIGGLHVCEYLLHYILWF